MCVRVFALSNITCAYPSMGLRVKRESFAKNANIMKHYHPFSENTLAIIVKMGKSREFGCNK